MSRARTFAPLGLAAAATACGLLSPDAEPVPAARDPWVGFVEGRPVEVCLSGTRLVSPSVATGGSLSLCVQRGSRARPCADTSSCGAGETCVCGRCVTRACRDKTECHDDEVCQGGRCTARCAADSQCPAGHACNGGGCAKRCASAADCAYGERCSALDEMCIAKTCSETVACSGDDECVPQEQLGELREPHLVILRGAKLAYVEIRTELSSTRHGCAIYRAKVTGEGRWDVDPPQPVVAPGPDDDECVGAPSAIVRGNGVRLYGARGDGRAIFRAWSSDGVSFQRDAADVLGPRWGWEGGWVGSPGVADFAGATVMLYEADRGRAVGIARVDEATGAATPVSWIAPSVFLDPVFWRATSRVGSPFPIVRGETLLAYLAVRGVEGSDAVAQSAGVYPADANDSIGLLGTRDLKRWERFATGPVFARRTNLRTYLGEREPALLAEGDATTMVYVGADATGQAVTGLGLARAGR
jgi:hypothetical protein